MLLNVKTTHADRAFLRIREGILLGEYGRHSVLHATVLAEDLRLSVVPVREALIRLKARGLLRQTEPRSGYYVSVIDRAEAISIYNALSRLYAHAIKRRVEDRLAPP